MLPGQFISADRDENNYSIVSEPGRGLLGNKQKRNVDYALLKSLADVWEAYWNGVLEERAVWGDGMEDVESFFMRLIQRKYTNLMMFAQVYHIDKGGDIDEYGGEKIVLDKRRVGRSDEVFVKEFGKVDSGGGEANEYGYLVRFPVYDTQHSSRSSQRFAVAEEDAVAQLLYSHWDEVKGTPPFPSC